MLLSFSVTNFRSFREEQTLSLLASKRLGATEESPHCCEIPGTGEHALRVASLYGANGAGKSNLVQALALVQRLVLHGTPPGKPIPHKPFLLDNESSAKPTSFEMQFVEEGEVFRYGLSYDADRVHEEWLDAYEGKNERSLFSRVTKEDETVTVTLGPTAKGATFSQKMKALAQVGARPNQLFLAEVVNLNDPEAQGRCLRRAVRWFESALAVIRAHEEGLVLLTEAIAGDEAFARFAGRFLRDANTGIADLDVEAREMPWSDLPGKFGDFLSGFLSGGLSVITSEHGEEAFLGESKDTIRTLKILALHDLADGQRAAFAMQEESDGSQRLLKLMPALYRLTKQGGVFVIDELERSMHPMLARKFIEFFLKTAPNAKSQLIFTTHESTLLDLDLMRRDGIWFSEKDQEGATHLYSLADFKVRKDLRIERGYLQGRFGAIPFLGGIDRLIEEQAAAEAKG